MAAVAAALIVIVSGAPRILLASGTLPEFLRPFIWSDALLVYARGLSGHRLPYVDTPFEYPPLIGAVSAALSVLAPDASTFVIGWTLVLAATAAIAAFALASASGARRVFTYWSLSPQLLLLSGINFDVLAVCFVALATTAQRSRREIGAAVGLAAGTAAKLFPLVTVPIALAHDRRRFAALGAFVMVLASIYLPTLAQPRSSAAGLSLYAVSIEANLDSVWGMAQRTLDSLGLPGSMLVLLITTTGLLATYLLHVFPRARGAPDVAAGFALATVVLLFWTRLYSPQYSIWLLPFFALVPLGWRVYALLTAADIGVFLTVYPLTLVPRSPEDLSSALLLAGLATFVVLRHAALLACWRRLSRLCDATGQEQQQAEQGSDRATHAR